MIKFTSTTGKVFAVNKAQVVYCQDTTPAPNHGVEADPSTTIYVGGTTFTVAQSIDDVMTALD